MDARTFIDNFGTLAETPGGVKKLRELILQMAVRGQLVEQDPDDEPASELLKQIEAEKAHLMKAGKVKVDKPLPPVDSGEELYELPAGWEWVRQGDLIDIRTGKKDVNQGHHDGLYPFFSCAAEPLKSNEYSFDCEALLLPGNGANVGMTTLYTGKFEAYQRTYVLSEFCGVTAHYAEVNLNARFRQSLVGEQYGSAINYIKIGNLTDFLIPLPPLAEQHRIVAKVDELMGLCDELEARQREREEARPKLRKACFAALTDDGGRAAISRVRAHMPSLCDTPDSVADLRQTILQLAVMGRLVPQDPSDEPASELLKKITAEKARLVAEGKIKKDKPLSPINPDDVPYDLPVGWEWTTVGAAAAVNGGFAFKSSEYTDSGVRVIRISDFDECGFKDGNVVRYTYSEEISSFRLETDSILMAMTGGTVGKSLLVKSLPEPMVVNQRVATIRVMDGIVPEYVYALMRTEIVQNVISHAKNSTNDNISMGDITGFWLPLPPLPEQHRIVAKVDSLMALCDKLEAKLKQSQADGEKLMASIVNSLVEAA